MLLKNLFLEAFNQNSRNPQLEGGPQKEPSLEKKSAILEKTVKEKQVTNEDIKELINDVNQSETLSKYERQLMRQILGTANQKKLKENLGETFTGNFDNVEERQFDWLIRVLDESNKPLFKEIYSSYEEQLKVRESVVAETREVMTEVATSAEEELAAEATRVIQDTSPEPTPPAVQPTEVVEPKTDVIKVGTRLIDDIAEQYKAGYPNMNKEQIIQAIIDDNPGKIHKVTAKTIETVVGNAPADKKDVTRRAWTRMKGKYYSVSQEITVRIGIKKVRSLEELVGEEDQPEVAPTADELKQEAADREAEALEAREEEIEEKAKIEDTQDILETGRIGRRRRLRLSESQLSGQEKQDLTNINFSERDFQEFKDNIWPHVQGRVAVEEIIYKRDTFANFDMEDYHASIRKGKNENVKFVHILNLVYSPAGARDLVQNLSETELSKKTLKKIKGNFAQDYHRVLELTDGPEKEAAILALNSIYKDVIDLYTVTGKLIYTPPVEDSSAQLNITQPREGAEQAEQDFVTRLNETLLTKDSERLTGMYKGLLRRSRGQVTYEDAETGNSVSLRKEQFEQYFSGEAVYLDIYDQFVTETYNEDHEKVITFDERGAVNFINRLIRTAYKAENEGQEPPENLLITNFNSALTEDQVNLVRHGYLKYAIFRHANETTPESQESAEVIGEKEPIKIVPSKEVIDATIEWARANIDDLSTEQEAQIKQKMLAGFSIGFLQTVDHGLTETHRVFDADGNLVSEETFDIREAGTKDNFEVQKLAIGKSFKVADIGNGQSLYVPIGGVFNLKRNEKSGGGAGLAYVLEAENGMEFGAFVGTSGNLGKQFGVGGQLSITVPAGPLKFSADAGAVTGGVFSLGGSVSRNDEWIYHRKLDKTYEEHGYTKIETMIAEGETIRDIAEQILLLEDFAGLREELKTLEHGGLAKINPEAQARFILEVYKAQRHEVAGEVFKKSDAIPLVPTKVGVKVLFVPTPQGYVPVPVPYVVVPLGNIHLVYRTTTNENYEELSDDRILRQFDQDLADGKFTLQQLYGSNEVPKMMKDRDGKERMITESEPFNLHGTSLATLASMNDQLHEVGLDLKPTDIGQGRKLLEMQVADIEGNLEIIIDPALKEEMQLVYQNGEGTEGDKFFLATDPTTNFTLRRQDFYYPFSKNGEYVRTVITITKNPVLTTTQLQEVERAAFLSKVKGSRTVEDAALSGTSPKENNIMTMDDYLKKTANQTIQERDEFGTTEQYDRMLNNHVELIGRIDLTSQAPAEVKEQLRQEAEILMTMPGESQADPFKEFRLAFKKYSTLGESYNPTKLAELVHDKGQELLGRSMEDNEFQYFVQTLNIYSFINLKALGPEGQEAGFDRMTDQFTRPELQKMFGALGVPHPDRATDLVIAKLTEGLDFSDPEQATQLAANVFGSLAGTEGIVGVRRLGDYRNDDLYKVLNLVKFDLDSDDPVEREIARSIVELLNPLPEEVEMTPENGEKIAEFLRDDFTLRVSTVWYFKDVAEGNQLRDLIQMAQHHPEAMSEPTFLVQEDRDLLTEFQDFVQKAREVQTAPKKNQETQRQIKLSEGYYVSFEDTSTAFGVFERCGNVSQFLAEKITIRNAQGQLIVQEDESHRMVVPTNARETISIGASAFMEGDEMGGHRNTREKPAEKEPGVQITPDERLENGSFTPGGINEGHEGEDAPDDLFE